MKNNELQNRTYVESYIAFLDILGFKEIVRKSEFDEVLEIFMRLTDDRFQGDGYKIALYRVTEGDDEFAEYNKSLNAVSVYIMSDSIVVSCPCDTPYPLEALIDVCNYFQCMLYDMDNPILLRGAISKGKYYCNKSVAFGKGMVDAYQYQEKFSIYPRIILSENLVLELKDEKYKGCEIVQDQRDLYWYIDCLKSHLEEKSEENAECQKFRTLINEYINGYYDAGIREKYMWLDREYKRIVNGMISVEGNVFMSEEK